MNAPAADTAWLAELAPDRAPPPPGWWPPAPGWWWLAAIVILAAAAVAVLWWRRQRRDRPISAPVLRRAVLGEIDRLEHAARDDAHLARELEHLMRRYAVARYGRGTVARLTGESWLAFAVAHGAREWSGEAGRALLRLAYGGTAAADRPRWLGGARGFVGFVQARLAEPGP